MDTLFRHAAVGVLFLGALAFAQNQKKTQQQRGAPPKGPLISTSVVVLGSPEPVSQSSSSRVVTVIDTRKYPLSVPTIEDYLRSDSSAFIEQRGAGDVQADISLRGGSFEQTLVLLDGLRINDAQSSHHNLDLPVPLAALKAIDVLHGTGSTLYGADALSGVVDFVTAAPTSTSLRLTTGAGSYGENEESAIVDIASSKWSEAATATRDFSTGFMYDRDYRTEEASSESRYTSRFGVSKILLAGSDRAFGANRFYGNFPSWERTKGWFASGSQELGSKTQAAFGYRRHTDNFILLRNDPGYYANNHVDTSWQAVARRKESLDSASRLYYGLDFQGDTISSNNLGRHARNRGAGYADLDLHFGQRGTLSVGGREELLSGGPQTVFSPALSASEFIGSRWKIRGAGGYGFRLPTYTDLYYSDPTTVGNPNLKPESAWSGEGGADWYANARLAASLTIFYSRQHDAIDYVRPSAGGIWRAANINGVSFTGVESSVNWEVTSRQSLNFSYAALYGAQSALHGQQSEYIFNYPVNNANAEWIAQAAGFVLRNRVGATQRYERGAYAVWDLSLARERGWIHPYLQATNLSNTGYEEIEGVRMQGRSLVVGLEIIVARR